MLAALVLTLALQDDPGREARVLELLAGMKPAGFYSISSFEARPAALGGVVYAHFFGAMCGNSDHGTFDDQRARELGRALAGCYDLHVVRDVVVREEGVAGLLDAWDPILRLGFKLRGRGCTGGKADALPEHPSTDLDDEELARLVALGDRLHVADVGSFRCFDGDEFTPVLAYLASLARFLNEATEGQDVELGGLLFEREARWHLGPALRLAPGMERVAHDRDSFELEVARAGTLVVPCRGREDLAPARAPFGVQERAERGEPFATSAGAPSVLCLSMTGTTPEGGHGAAQHLRVRQERDGVERVHEADGAILFLPGTFDLAQPFTLELDLAPGRYVNWAAARLGAAARD